MVTGRHAPPSVSTILALSEPHLLWVGRLALPIPLPSSRMAMRNKISGLATPCPQPPWLPSSSGPCGPACRSCSLPFSSHTVATCPWGFSLTGLCPAPSCLPAVELAPPACVVPGPALCSSLALLQALARACSPPSLPFPGVASPTLPLLLL